MSSGTNQTRTVSGDMSAGTRTMAWTRGTVGWRRPPSSLRDAGERAVGADDNVGVQLFRAGVPGALDANAQAVSVALQRSRSGCRTKLLRHGSAPARQGRGSAATRSMIRSGRSRGTWAARPSVKSSNLRISLTTARSPTSPSRVRMWLVTISVRGVGSKLLGPLEDFHRAAGSRQKRSGEKT